ncbi:MAG: HAMP domain-containing sensor histidine kinase [Candidatus Saccharimonas sp.]
MKTNVVVKFVHSTTGRLALTYLGIIMLMSIGFSFAFYSTSARQLGRQLPPSSFFENYSTDSADQTIPGRGKSDVEIFIRQRIDEGRSELLMRLIWLNIVALILGGALSYALARRALRPIEKAMNAQLQFIGDASHELRTPLTAIRVSNEVALRKSKLSLAEAKELISQNTEDVTRLQTLSDDLLRLVNGEDVDHELSSISLQAVVAEAMNQVVQLAQAKSIEVDDQVSNIKVIANKQSLIQIITILLDNAIKYSEPKTAITLEATADTKYAYLEVKDEGIGIQESDQAHVFERFYRADKSRSKQQHEGYGLGLSIADRLVAQQRGEITVKSTLGHGSTFIIKLHIN